MKFLKTFFNKINSNLHYLMVLPAMILFSIFFIGPLLSVIGLSLTDYNGLTAPNFIGFKNFINFLYDLRARKDIINTVFFAMGSAPLLNIFGFIYALVLDKNFKAKSIVRAIVYLPAIISPLIMGYIWYFILQPKRGILFVIAKTLNLGIADANWLGDRYMALLVLVFVNVWQYVGITMIIYLAGLQLIPVEVVEAAKIDGASYFRTLRSIIIPLITPAIKINVVTNIIGSLSVFEIIVALTDGGPGYNTESLSIYILRMVHGSFAGYSTAVAVILFLIILPPVVIFLKWIRSKEVEM